MVHFHIVHSYSLYTFSVETFCGHWLRHLFGITLDRLNDVPGVGRAEDTAPALPLATSS